MNTIQTLTVGRLINSRNVNDGISTDFTNKNFKVPVVLANLINGGKYLAVISDINIGFLSESLVTTIIHYEFSTISNKWNKLDSSNIDTDLYPNLDKLITNTSVLLNITNGKVANVGDAITLNPNGTQKNIYVSYFDYLRFSTLGLSIETMLTNDVKARLSTKIVI